MPDDPGTAESGAGQEVLVPSRALDEVSRLLGHQAEVTLVLGDTDVTFEIGPLHVSTQLIQGDFPDYRRLIPTTRPPELTVGRQSLIDALKRVKLMAADHTPVRLSMSADLLELRTKNSDLGEAVEEIDAKYAGEDLEVAFNPEFLLHGLEVTPGDQVCLESTDATKPATLRSWDSADFLYLLMPVRVT